MRVQYPDEYFVFTLPVFSATKNARRVGAEVAGWTLDRKIRVWFPAYPHRVWALWWQGCKRSLWTSRCPCQGRLGTLKTPSCPWRGCPAAGQNLETGHLSRHYIAEISVYVTFNHNQQQQQQHPVFSATKNTRKMLTTILPWNRSYGVLADHSVDCSECRPVVYQNAWNQEKKEEIWLSPMTKAHTPTEMSKGQSDNINNATKKFDYTAVADRLRTVSWSNYSHPTGVVNRFTGPPSH